jgi:hypothetical protein
MIGFKPKNIMKVKKPKVTKVTKEKKFNKQRSLINKIIASIIVLISLIIAIFSSFSYVFSNIKMAKQELTSLKLYTNKLEQTIKDIEDQERTANKYIKIWNELPEIKRQTNGIKLNEIKNLLQDLTESYNFKNINITAEAPTELVGIFSKGNVGTSTILITIEFNTFFDTYVYKFVEEVVKKLPGNTIIDEIFIKKVFEINEKYLQTANKNMKQLPIQARTKIRLYGINKKNGE